MLGIVRSNVEDLLIVATLLDKYKLTTIDLRQELDALLKDGGEVESEEAAASNATVKKLPKFGDKKTTKSGILFYLKAG